MTKMKKKFLLGLFLAFFALLMVGCQKTLGTFKVEVLDAQAKELYSEAIKYYKDDTVLSILQKHEKLAVKGTTSQYGFFIEEVYGKNASSLGKFHWSISVDGKSSEVGISDIKLKDKMVLTLKIERTADGYINIIVVDNENKELFNDYLPFFDEDSTLGVLQKNEKLNIKGNYFGESQFFITTICEIEASSINSNAFWELFVNDVSSLVGISDIELIPNMKLTFKLTIYQPEL